VSAIRAFFALDLRAEDVERAASLADRMAKTAGMPRASWVKAKNHHVTLRFLGETEDSLVPILVAELTAIAGQGELETALGPLDAFPSARRARVLVLSVADGDGRIAALAARMENLAIAHGFPAEPRPFVPHLTLARCRPPADVRRIVSLLGPIDLGRAVGTRVVLYRSDPGSGGTTYVPLAAAELGVTP
jgi:RNA 2',3'-cyclic 3'-phosphodiesterase